MNFKVITGLIFAMNIAVLLVALAYCKVDLKRPEDPNVAYKCTYAAFNYPRHKRAFLYYSFDTLRPTDTNKVIKIQCHETGHIIMNEMIIFTCDWQLPPLIRVDNMASVIIERTLYSSKKKKLEGHCRITIVQFCSQNTTGWLTERYDYIMEAKDYYKHRPILFY